MGGKYPTPSEARARFLSGVERNKDEWVRGCREGADDYQTWFVGFAKEVYPVIAGLPAKTGDVEKNVDLRCKPVARKIHEIALEYRKTKLEEIERKLEALITAR